MNLRLRRKSAEGLDRRQFLLRGGCGAMGLTSVVNTIAQLKLMQGVLNAQSGGGGYKALVCVFLAGGNDSNNLLIPYTGSARTDYQANRGVLAIPTTGANPLTNLAATQLTTQAGHVTAADPLGGGYLGTFAVHPQCGHIKDLFNAGKLAFVANTGTLVQPGITRANYGSSPKPPQLFSHSDQVTQWQSSVPDKPFTSGWGGRIADLLDPAFNSGSSASMSISIAGVNSFQVSPTGLVAPYVIRSGGVINLSGYGTNYASAVNNPSQIFQDSNYRNTEQGRRLRAFEQILQMSNESLMENAYNGVMTTARLTEGVVGSALAVTASGTATTLDSYFTDAFTGAPGGITATTNDFTNQMKLVARLIAGRSALGNNRQVFFVQLGGFDTHTTQIPTGNIQYTTGHTGLMNILNCTLKGFHDSLQSLGVWNDVVTFSASDFTRTFTANKTDASAGSDHAWGGHTFVMGGPVLGGRIYGKFPVLKLGAVTNSIDATGSSGRWIPSTSVDQYAAVIARWLGVDVGNLPTIFPNLTRFDSAPFDGILQVNGAKNLGFLNLS